MYGHQPKCFPAMFKPRNKSTFSQVKKVKGSLQAWLTITWIKLIQINLHWWRGTVWDPPASWWLCRHILRSRLLRQSDWPSISSVKSISPTVSGSQTVSDSSINFPALNQLSWQVRQNAERALASQGGRFGSLCQWVKFQRETNEFPRNETACSLSIWKLLSFLIPQIPTQALPAVTSAERWQTPSNNALRLQNSLNKLHYYVAF